MGGEKIKFYRSCATVVDREGRIKIPDFILQNQDINPDDSLEAVFREDEIVLKKAEFNCYFCSGSGAERVMRGRAICSVCGDELKNLVKEN